MERCLSVLLVASLVCILALAKLLWATYIAEGFIDSETILQHVDPTFGSSGLLIPVVRDGAGGGALFSAQRPAEYNQQTVPPAPNPGPTTPSTQSAPRGDGTYTPIDASLPLDTQLQKFLETWPASEYTKTKSGDSVNIYEVNNLPMRENKALIQKLSNKLGIPESIQLLIIAKGMIETEALNVSGRDLKKDPGGTEYCGEGCINFGFANLNASMIRDALALGTVQDVTLADIKATGCAPDKASDTGPTATCNPAQSLLNQDSEAGYEAVLKLVKAGIEAWGIDRYVDYLRGGGTMFNEPSQANLERFKVKMFKQGLSLTIEAIKKDPALLKDNRRVALNIDYVGGQA